MNLAIDIGNTRTKIGVFQNGVLEYEQASENGAQDFLLEIATNHRVQNIILSTVASGLNQHIRQELERLCYVLELDAATPLPIRNLYQTPETLGKDRLAAIVGAYALWPGEHCLVIDAGTCITYDFLRQDGAFLGGNIAPGIGLRLKAMHTFTARLPLVPRGEVVEWVGRSTEEALRNGAQLGALLEIEGFIRYCQSRFGDIQVLFTGGDADFFAKNMKSQIFVHQNLVLLGLNQILNHNVKRLE
jgi:type III pantothenate kinase